MKPALQALTAAHESGGINELISDGGHRKEVTWFNYTTLTYTSELCLVVGARDGVGAMPRVRFEVMRYKCA